MTRKKIPLEIPVGEIEKQEEALQVEMVVPAEDEKAPPKGLLEKMGLTSSKVQFGEKKKRGRASAKAAHQIALSEVIGPLLASSVASYAIARMPEEYSQCAPTIGELELIFMPLLNVINRRVAVYSKLNQDMVDITTSLACASIYGLRAITTYWTIKGENNRGIGSRHGAESEIAGNYPSSGSGNRVSNGESVDDNHGVIYQEKGRYSEREAIAELFHRDYEGSARLGLHA